MTVSEKVIYTQMRYAMSLQASPKYFLAAPWVMRAIEVGKVQADAQMEADLKYPLFGMKRGPRKRKVKRYVRRAVQAWKRANRK